MLIDYFYAVRKRTVGILFSIKICKLIFFHIISKNLTYTLFGAHHWNLLDTDMTSVKCDKNYSINK